MRRGKLKKARQLREYVKEGYIVAFFYKDHYMKFGNEFHVEDLYTNEESRYIGLITNESVGTCNGEGEAVAGFNKDFRKQVESSESVQVLLYKDLPEDIKKFFNKEILRGDENERYNKRRTATI